MSNNNEDDIQPMVTTDVLTTYKDENEYFVKVLTSAFMNSSQWNEKTIYEKIKILCDVIYNIINESYPRTTKPNSYFYTNPQKISKDLMRYHLMTQAQGYLRRIHTEFIDDFDRKES